VEVEGTVEDGVGAVEWPAGVDTMESGEILTIILEDIHAVLTLE
jgi:hypothetical protein